MRRALTAIAAWLLVTGTAHGWNDKGHMVVARLAWRALSPEIRRQAVSILEAHPHYREYLRADQPSAISADEWTFLRAAAWPDWVRFRPKSGYYKPRWHFINLPYVPPGSHLKREDFPPEVPNAVTQLELSLKKVRNGSAEERAIFLCWVLHLVGDLHQPLHCAALFSEQFPKGDQGGNRALVRISGKQTGRLHLMWDNLLGQSIAPASLAAAVAEIETLKPTTAEGGDVAGELAAHTTPTSWAQESFATARIHCYIEGRLRVANAETRPSAADVPVAPADYAANSGRVARLCILKAGRRLAQAVSESLR